MIDVNLELTVTDGRRRFDLAARFATDAPFAALYGPSGSGKSLTLQQLAASSLVVASPTATFHASVEQTLVRMKLADRVVVRARHFGALPDLALNSDLLTIVPQMYAANLLPRHDLRVWDLPAAAAPAYEVRLVWHASTAQDPAQQWIRSQVHALFGRGD